MTIFETSLRFHCLLGIHTNHFNTCRVLNKPSKPGIKTLTCEPLYILKTRCKCCKCVFFPVSINFIQNFTTTLQKDAIISEWKYWRYWMKWDKVKKRLKSAKQVNFWPSIIHDCTNLIRLNISKGNGIMQCTDIGFVHVFVSFHKQTLMLNIIYMGIKELICKGHWYEMRLCFELIIIITLDMR